MSNTITKRDAMKLLVVNYGNLSERDSKFADSLIGQFNTKGNLSENQWHWVAVLAKRAMPQEARVTEVVELPTFSKVINLFNDAKLKRPSVRLQLDDGSKIKLHQAGAASQHAGQIQVTNGVKYGEPGAVWYGRINTNGHFTISDKIDADTATSLVALLSEFSSKPQTVAMKYGRDTGNCCFCSKTLTDGRSVKVGYGPICADKWSLPWGE